MKLLYIHDTKIDSEEANLIQVVQMCHAFGNNGVDVTLALPEQTNLNTKKQYEDTIESKFGIKINFSIETFHKITVFKRLNFAGGVLGVKKLLKNVKAEICFIRRASFISSVLKAKIPLIYESHNTISHEGSSLLNALWTHHIIYNSNHNNFKKFITISQTLSDYWMTKGVPKEKLLPLHDGFDNRKFEKIKQSCIARNELNLPDNKKIVMYVGSLYKDRGIETIIELSKNFDDVLFVVVGGPENEKKYYERIASANNLNNIVFRGRVPHHMVQDYLWAADVLLMIWTRKVKTINFCSPLKTFEYMASGRLIVGHSFPTIKEILEDGINALLANPDYFDDLEKKLSLALHTHKDSDLGEKARDLALNQYSWDQRAKSIIDQL